MAAHPTLAHAPSRTGEPEPTAGDDPGHECYLSYLDTLRELGGQGAAVNSALLEAHTADTVQQRRAALTALRTRLGDMATTADDALARCPEPEPQPGEAS